MPYTDSQGRPEIIADPGLKLGTASYQIEEPAAAAAAPPEPGPAAPEPRAAEAVPA